jgi:hypothetical protein
VTLCALIVTMYYPAHSLMDALTLNPNRGRCLGIFYEILIHRLNIGDVCDPALKATIGQQNRMICRGRLAVAYPLDRPQNVFKNAAYMPRPWCLSPICFRNYWRIAVSLWTQVTASDPSPTAKPTRLVEPDRISPAARIPGTVVSSGQGSRLVSGQRPDFIASTPVST